MRASLVVLAACGRVGFDSTGTGLPCAPVGHDEDGDGVDDACDVCPHVADDQTDTDGDGVGDACDPLTTPTEHIELFDPFTIMRSTAWTYSGGEVFTGDTIALPATMLGSMRERLVATPTVDMFVLTGTIGAVSGTSHQFAMTFGDASSHNVYCEAYEDATATYVDIVDYDGTTYKTLDTAPLPGGHVMDTSFVVAIRYAPPNITCEFTFDGTLHRMAGSLPNGYVATGFSFVANRLDIGASSFAWIRTTP